MTHEDIFLQKIQIYLLSCGTLEARNRYKEYGWFGDAQSPNSWSCYNDLLMTTLLLSNKKSCGLVVD